MSARVAPHAELRAATTARSPGRFGPTRLARGLRLSGDTSFDCGGDTLRVDDVAGDMAQLLVVVAGVPTQPSDGSLHLDAQLLRDDALGLSDADVGLQDPLQLFFDRLGAVQFGWWNPT